MLKKIIALRLSDYNTIDYFKILGHSTQSSLPLSTFVISHYSHVYRKFVFFFFSFFFISLFLFSSKILKEFYIVRARFCMATQKHLYRVNERFPGYTWTSSRNFGSDIEVGGTYI